MALNTIYNVIDSKVFEQIKDLDRASEVWKRLEETYKGTLVVKSAKLYILKDKLISSKMKDDESIPEMFHRLQVIVNDLKALGEKINDDDVSHWFLMCLYNTPGVCHQLSSGFELKHDRLSGDDDVKVNL
jgi:hypothetical protein